MLNLNKTESDKYSEVYTVITIMKSVDLCHKVNQIKGIKFKSKYNFLDGSIAKFTWWKLVDHSAIVNACEILGPGRGMVGWYKCTQRTRWFKHFDTLNLRPSVSPLS